VTGHREHLLGQPGRALLERLGELALGRPPQLDAVADLEAAALAGVLHQAHRLADQPRAAQLRRDLEVERDGLAGAGRDRPAGARASR
jgi:hypothetical protein